MKAFSLLCVGVLFSTLAFANGIDEPKESASSVSVSNLEGSTLVKVYYKADQTGTVKVSILKGKRILFTETLKKVSGFVRPYNFENLTAGEYTVQVEDKYGKRLEQVTYEGGRIAKYVGIVKLAQQGKYLITVNSKSSDQISVNVYNERNEVVHSQTKNVASSFAEVLNIKNINQFTIEVSDSQGVLKTVKNE